MQWLKALACQAAALVLTASLNRYWPQPLGWLLLIQAGAAGLFSRLLRQPKWWLPIHLVFLPALVLATTLQLSPVWYLAGFLVMLLVFWGTFRGDVPLFLSSPAVALALADIAKTEGAKTCVEIGAGVGSVALPLARQCPKLRIAAWERAPLPWLLARWRCRHQSNVAVQRCNLWQQSLAEYDLGYAFLSPAVMIQIGGKVRAEMRPGSLFVSSSFPIPDWPPETVVELADPRRTRLYCYRLPELGGPGGVT
ncbi:MULTISPECIES: hypothetical protein [Methylomonas]|uniref:Methyltransferase type 12 n=1 Tax=Methylomonas koyamae TaxID=702114 RepID=A0A177N9I7_9GAMM|nr:hypothetical protein [Methylomonas koyamae]OAI14678.1 hypothetical protein A1355_12010 [Methylomonas koyamae]